MTRGWWHVLPQYFKGLKAYKLLKNKSDKYMLMFNLVCGRFYTSNAYILQKNNAWENSNYSTQQGIDKNLPNQQRGKIPSLYVIDFVSHDNFYPILKSSSR